LANDEINTSVLNQNGDLLAETPVLSPLIRLTQFNYPVHQISPDYLPDAPCAEPNYLLVYRNQNNEVQFMVLNPVSAALIQGLQDNHNRKTGRECLENLAELMQHPKPERVIQTGLETLNEFLDKDIVLGVVSP